jgi:hypothetical protein
VRRGVVLLLLALAAAACSTSRDETWVGENADVTVDSIPGDTPADAR